MNNRAVALATLSYEERYMLGYMEGYRIGQITASRKVLINCLRIKAKEQGIVFDKKLIQKINRETDLKYLLNIVLDLSKDKLSVKELEMHYDRYFI